MGADFSLLASGYHSDEFFEMVQQSLASQGHWEGEVRNRRKTGEIFVAWLSINQVCDNAGKVVQLVTGFSDITEYCAEAERIAQTLTAGLPSGKAVSRFVPLPMPRSGEQRLSHPAAQAHVLIGLPALKRGDPDFFALQVGN